MVALITGGSSGMGLEFACQLAEKGYDLVLVSNREEELRVAVQELTWQFPVHVEGHFQDLALPDAADALFAWCGERGLLPGPLVQRIWKRLSSHKSYSK